MARVTDKDRQEPTQRTGRKGTRVVFVLGLVSLLLSLQANTLEKTLYKRGVFVLGFVTLISLTSATTYEKALSRARRAAASGSSDP